jgi:hypothetical protein
MQVGIPPTTGGAVRKRGKKHGAKRSHGGVRGSIVKKFGKPFKDIILTISETELAELSPAQLEYIKMRKAAGMPNDEVSDDE